jgi:hypothetical protein
MLVPLPTCVKQLEASLLRGAVFKGRATRTDVLHASLYSGPERNDDICIEQVSTTHPSEPARIPHQSLAAM